MPVFTRSRSPLTGGERGNGSDWTMRPVPGTGAGTAGNGWERVRSQRMTAREQLRDREPRVPELERSPVQPLDTTAPCLAAPATAEPEPPRARAAETSAPQTQAQAWAHAREERRADGGVSYRGRSVARFEENGDGSAIVRFELPPSIAQKLKGLWPSILDVRLEGEFSGQKAAVTLRTPVGPPTRRERMLERRAAHREAR